MSRWSKRLFFVSLVLVLAAGTALAQQTPAPAAKSQEATASSQGAPHLTLVDPTKDFGTVPKGEKLTWAFSIKNTGNADLEITNVQPACGCTVAEFDKVIKPGQTGKVTATVDTTNFSGPIGKSVMIYTNDPEARTAQVSINAIVRPYVEASPAGFVRYSLIQGDADSKYLTLYTEEDEPFKILAVETPGEWAKVEYAVATAAERVKVGNPNQVQYRLRITVGGPTAPIGPLVDKIKILTNSKHQPEYRISLSGIIRPGFNVAPSVVNFGEVPVGEATSRVVMLSSNRQQNPGAFKVSRVESSNSKLFTAESKETEPGHYEVTVTLAKDAKAGQANAELKIYTTDAGTPVRTIPLIAMIKG